MQCKQNTITGILLFIPVFLFFWLRIDPRLIYHAQEPPFLFGPQFFSGFAAYPGGLAWYASAFLTQFFIYPVVGAVIGALFVLLVRWQTGRLMKSPGINFLRDALASVPALLVLIAYADYRLPLAYVIGLSVALTLFNCYRYICSLCTILGNGRAWVARLALFSVLTIVIYYSAGTGALLFVVLCILYEFLRRRPATGVLMLVFAASLPAAAAYALFVLTVPQAYLDFVGLRTFLLDAAPYPRMPGILYGAFACFPLLLIVSGLGRSGPDRDNKQGLGPIAIRSGIAAMVVHAALVALGLAYAGFWNVDEKVKANLRIDLLARKQQWGKIVEEITPANMQQYTVLSHLHLFRAQFHTNRLLSELFSYPQAAQGQAFQVLTTKLARQYPIQMSDCYFEVGALNMAEFWANEAMALQGKKPRILQRLAQIYLVRGNRGAAEKYISLLENTLFYRDTAVTYARLLDNDSLLMNDYLRHVRMNMPHREYVCTDMYAELASLFDNNKRNRMAFEYLLAGSLLNNAITLVVEHMDYFRHIGYSALPRHIQEALVFQMAASNTITPTVAGYSLDDDIVGRFNEFNEALYQGRTDRAAALYGLAQRFGTTYWYYLATSQRQVYLKK